jgi:putative endonuclease
MTASRRHGTLYIGVTSRFPARISEHREGLISGFTKTYGVKRLVWYETHESILCAIQREKSLKKYKRDWKINLIERENPYWEDLYPGACRAALSFRYRRGMGGRDKPGQDRFVLVLPTPVLPPKGR